MPIDNCKASRQDRKKPGGKKKREQGRKENGKNRKRGNRRKENGRKMSVRNESGRKKRIRSSKISKPMPSPTTSGVLNILIGQYTHAIKDFDISIGLKSDYADAYFGRGYAKGKLGDYNKAIPDYNEAIRLKTRLCFSLLLSGFGER